MKCSAPDLIRRTTVYIAGLFSLALGVAFSVNADLGVSPVNSLPYVCSRISGTALGTCVILVFSAYILLQILTLRKDFRWINLMQLVFSTIFGYFVNLSKLLLGDFTIPSYFGSLLMAAVSIVLVALGIMLYVEAGLIPMPLEGLTIALSDKSGIPFHNMKILVDCIVAAASTGLCLLCLGRLDGIREGTVLTALLVGKVIPVLQRAIGKPVRGFCGQEA